MRHLTLAAVFFLTLAPGASWGGFDDEPIPQNPEKQERRYRELLATSRRTLGEAYEKVGKKDPKWDAVARKALDDAARLFSGDVNPRLTFDDVYRSAKKAVDAGCDDPLVLFLYARTSYARNDPGPAERERRYVAAAAVMERSAYPPARRAVSCSWAAEMKAAHRDDPEALKEAARLFDLTLALLAENYAADEKDGFLELTWYTQAELAVDGFAMISGDRKQAYDRVDAVLARTPALKALRLELKGKFYTDYAWEARGTGFAPTVTEEGWRKFAERLEVADAALREAWALRPGKPRVPTLMLVVQKGSNADRGEMEAWFRRAMEADPGNVTACAHKREWLNPKWHGTPEEMLAFGRACRATKNWRSGIPLQVAEVHYQLSWRLSADERRAYMNAPEVWDDISDVFEDRLRHIPEDHFERSMYAGYCCLCGRLDKAREQLLALGDNLVFTTYFPEAWWKSSREKLFPKK